MDYRRYDGRVKLTFIGDNMKTIPQAVFDSVLARRITKKGHEEATLELACTPVQLLDIGNPNNPIYENKIFGYSEKEFLAKQYK